MQSKTRLLVSRTEIVIDIFLRQKQSIKDLNNVAKKVMEKLQFEGLRTITHTSGTNNISIYLNDKKNLSEKIKEIDKIKEIGYFILWTNPKQEILDAISDHDYFKAFALSSTTYEYFGKRILINHIKKNKIPINDKKINGLQLDAVIKDLHNYGIIDEGLKSDMTNVNKTRISFIHHKLSQVIGKEEFQKINENIPKINSSLDKLQKIYQFSN